MSKNFVDASATTYEWDSVDSGICILPVGSMEQHAHHMPLKTDAIQAEYFARVLAEEFHAALLPVIPIATSYEHTGFRGTFSLKPETLMAVVRDLADEASRQDFKIMIVLNGHGGNFTLGPVVRDINRSGSSIRLLLCNWYEHGFWKAEELATEVHASRAETSLMMHIAPDLVGYVRPSQLDEDWQEQHIKRQDLNHFGVKVIAPEGVVGSAAQASPEEGKVICERVTVEIIEWARFRVAKIRKTPSYAP